MDDLKFNRTIKYSEHLKAIKENLRKVKNELDRSISEIENLLACRSTVVQMIDDAELPVNPEFDAVTLDKETRQLWIKASSVLSVLRRMSGDINAKS